MMSSRASRVVFFAIVSSWIFPAQLRGQTDEAYTVYSTAGKKAISFSEMVSELGKAQVIFFGEQHDDSLGHRLQDALYTALLDAHGEVTLSLEMFETDVQLVVDEYLQGFITQGKLIAEGRAWDDYLDHYHSMVETAKERGQKVVAANAPRRYVNLVSRKGLDALNELPKRSKQWLPPLPVQVGDSTYRARFDEIMGGGHGMDMDRFFEAQCLWDGSMAYRVFKAWKGNKSTRILHLNGRFHTDYRGGTYAELKRLSPRLKIMNISCFEVEDAEAVDWTEYAGIADFVIVHAAKKAEEQP